MYVSPALVIAVLPPLGKKHEERECVWCLVLSGVTPISTAYFCRQSAEGEE